MKYTSLFAAAYLAVFAFQSDPALAQNADDPVSQCLAIAQSTPRVILAALDANPLEIEGDVTITYSGHSTYRIETPAGVVAATDFSGLYGSQPTLPRIVTMNRAHSSHHTLSPDPAIEFVLAGWNDLGAGPIDHDLVVDDIYVRNVATDIRTFGDGMIADGNSIFIFEVAGLCIGHLGHLHHPLTDDHFAQIGRLDIVMVPVDGGLTLSHQAMAAITTRLRSSIVLPMHLRGNSISSFISRMGPDWKTEYLKGNAITVSVGTLPKQPTIMVPRGLGSGGGFSDF
jgi:L-ascorbate metabolism protein UlaG (beta-lactamase superfamily)